MSEHGQTSPENSELRRRAEAEWERSGGQAALPATEVETARLLHELQVHQIELEMQNDELRRAKEETKEHADELETMYRNAPAIMLLVDEQRRVCKANEAAALFAGHPVEELAGTRCGELLHCLHAREHPQGCGFGSFCGECAVRHAISDAIETGTACKQEETTVSVPGEEHTDKHVFLLSCAPLTIRDAPMALVTLLDITQRKGAEAERERLAALLRQSEKLTAIGQLAGGIAHNFNNQLGGIVGYADMLRSRVQEPDLHRYADNILTASRRAADLTEQILSFARKGKRVSAPFDLHALLEETIAILQGSIDRRIELHRHFVAKSATVIGDPSQLNSVFLNLGLNARDAMPRGGTLSFATACVELDAPKARELGVEPARYLRATVSDTGSGLPPEALKHLVEPFFTTKEVGKGTGLGLAAAHGAIVAHRGAITGRNIKGRGAAFTIYLPLAEETITCCPKPPESTTMQSAIRVLLVDDEPGIRQACSEVLRDLGCDVTTCADGVEAIARYRQCWRQIDLVILDIVMPRMGGRDVFAALRAINPDVNVLVVSGYSIDEEAEAILQDGARAFLQKPFTGEKLSQKVAEVMQHGKELALPNQEPLRRSGRQHDQA